MYSTLKLVLRRYSSCRPLTTIKKIYQMIAFIIYWKVYEHLAFTYLYIMHYYTYVFWVSLWRSGKESISAGVPGLIPGSRRSLGKGNGKPLLYSCLERGDWQATVYGMVKESDVTQETTTIYAFYIKIYCHSLYILKVL